MAASFPKCWVVRAATNALFVTVGETLKASEEFPNNPLCRFEIEKAKTEDTLYNVRSCHNNKYWVKEAPDSPYLTAGADEPNEDPSSWSCTLMKVGITDGSLKFQLFPSDKYIAVELADTAYQHSLYEFGNFINKETEFFIFAAQPLLTLPKQVAYKGTDAYNFNKIATEEEPLSIK